MPRIESITTTIYDQRVAYVRVDRSEKIFNNDVFPHFAGRQYKALSYMTLVDGPQGEWKPNEHGVDERLVLVIVAPVEPGKATAVKKRRPQSPRQIILTEAECEAIWSADKAAE